MYDFLSSKLWLNLLNHSLHYPKGRPNQKYGQWVWRPIANLIDHPDLCQSLNGMSKAVAFAKSNEAFVVVSKHPNNFDQSIQACKVITKKSYQLCICCVTDLRYEIDVSE